MPSTPIHGTYDWRLVVLSVVIAVFASYAALDLAGRITASRRRARLLWLTGGATSMGLGIWSMHYIGMLAFCLPIKMYYDPLTVLISLLAAIAASAVALYTVSRKQMATWQTIVGSVFMGSGIAAMHYIGMAAMRLQAQVQYDPWLVTASIILAIAISLVALVLSFRVRNESRSSRRKVISALVMGSAIPVMHYTGMWAATFYPSTTPVDLSRAISISSLGMTAIAASTLLILTLTIVTSFLDRLLSAQKEVAVAAQERELYFRSMADAIPQMVWTALPDGAFDFCNQRWLEFTGAAPTQANLRGWDGILHPEDLPVCKQKWQEAIGTGNPYETECRVHHAPDHSYCWHLSRAVPVRGADNAIVKWFGTLTNIEDQKRSQRDLEEQVRERTEALLQANAQLTAEMEQRQRTQMELDSQTAQLVKELTERSRNSTLLAQMGELLQSCTSMDEAFSIVLGFAPKMFPLLRGAVILLNASRTLLEVVGNWADCQLSSSVFEPNSCWALRTGHRYLIAARDRGVPCAHAATLAGSTLCIPIQAHGEALGVIHFQCTSETHEISELELSLAGTFAEQTGLSIANIRLREALRSQSIRDSLTGLFNRRYLEETLEREVHRAARTQQPLGVVMLDLDHFKTFNDTFGHDAGDAVLHDVGVFFLRHTRADDIACRFGGGGICLDPAKRRLAGYHAARGATAIGSKRLAANPTIETSGGDYHLRRSSILSPPWFLPETTYGCCRRSPVPGQEEGAGLRGRCGERWHS